VPAASGRACPVHYEILIMLCRLRGKRHAFENMQ
jgi:hypothetical protein